MVNQREVLYLTGGLVAGLAAGVLIAKSIFKKEYERLADEEIQSVKERYRYIRKEGMELPPRDPHEDSRQYLERINSLNYAPDPTHQALFESDIPRIPAGDAPRTSQTEDRPAFVLDESYSEVAEPREDFDEYKRTRAMNEPYVISVDEFMQDKQEYDKISLDYYVEDEVIADQSDRPYDDHISVLGTDWDVMFGIGSDDKNVVYVRNDDLEIDFEISRDERSYTEVALGIKEPREQIGKFREDD